MNAAPSLSWQALRAARDGVSRRWPSPFRLPLHKRPTDLLYGRLTDGMRLLDVGAGDSTRRARVAARFPAVEYVSVDTDAAAGADHATVAEAGTGFDVATLFEVIEHVSPEVALALLRATGAALREGGTVIVSVPCVLTPGRFERDCTHVTPWAHDELGAVLVLAGLEVRSLHRTYPAPFVRRLVRRAVLGPLGHLLGLDYAYSVVAVGVRPTD